MNIIRIDRTSPYRRNKTTKCRCQIGRGQAGVRKRGRLATLFGALRGIRGLPNPFVHNHVLQVNFAAAVARRAWAAAVTISSKRLIPFIRIRSRPPTREPTSTSSGTSRLTVTSDTSALATALQTALNGRTAPTRSQSQPVDLAVPPTTQQVHLPHAWHSQPAAFRRGEFRSGWEQMFRPL